MIKGKSFLEIKLKSTQIVLSKFYHRICYALKEIINLKFGKSFFFLWSKHLYSLYIFIYQDNYT
jgi:hypothetical protein